MTTKEKMTEIEKHAKVILDELERIDTYNGFARSQARILYRDVRKWHANRWVSEYSPTPISDERAEELIRVRVMGLARECYDRNPNLILPWKSCESLRKLVEIVNSPST